MEDREFFDHLYSVWAKTTGADKTFWMPEEHSPETVPQTFDIWAVSEDESRELVASYLSDEDSDFTTSIHGCFADVVRRVMDALDEADRLDEEKDDLVVRVADLESQADDLNGLLEHLEGRISDMEDDLDEANDEINRLSEFEFMYEALQ